MRISYRQKIAPREGPPNYQSSTAIPLEWQQEWFTNLCLAVVLAALTFLMLLSILLVLTKPTPLSIPGGTGDTTEEAAYAQNDDPMVSNNIYQRHRPCSPNEFEQATI